jgi:quinol monooxygenase YgiN
MDIIVQHEVRDYDEWKPAFDGHEQVRVKYGCLGHTIYRDPDDPNQLTVFTSWRTREGAEGFVKDPSLRDVMQKGGVISEPRVTMLEEAETHTYAATQAA